MQVVLRFVRILILVLSLTILASSTAFAANWTQYQHDALHTGFNAAETGLSRTSVSGLTRAWSASTTTFPTDAVIVANGRLFASSGDQLFAFDAASGAPLWQHADCSSPEVATQPAFAGGRVWIGDAGGDFAGYDAASGTQVFCDDFGGSIVTPPAASNGVLYVGNDLGDLFAVDAGSGTVLWTVNLDMGIVNTPAVKGRFLYVSRHPSRVFKLRITDGSIVWSRRVEPPGQCCISAVTVGDSSLFVGEWELHSLSTGDGAEIWANSDLGVAIMAPALAYGKVFAEAEDPEFGIGAFDAQTGSTIWVRRNRPNEVFAPLSVANGVLFVMHEAGPVQMYNTDTGAFIAAKSNPDGLPYNSSAGITVVNGTVYVPTDSYDGQVNVIDAWRIPTAASFRASRIVAA